MRHKYRPLYYYCVFKKHAAVTKFILMSKVNILHDREEDKNQRAMEKTRN